MGIGQIGQNNFISCSNDSISCLAQEYYYLALFYQARKETLTKF